MLNGVAPILIFSFIPQFISAFSRGVAGIPIIGDVIPTGIPIPLYLDENLTGIYIESEAKAIDIITNAQQRFDDKAGNVDQQGLNNLVTINMLANRASIGLSIILALNDMIFSRVVSGNYRVSYFNGNTTVFNGFLHGFSTNQGSDDDLIRVVMQLTKQTNVASTTSTQTALPNITGATNLVRPPTP